MDFTQSPDSVVHAGTGRRLHSDVAAIPSVWSAKDGNSIIWSLMSVVQAAGLAGVQFDPDNPASYTKVRDAILALIASNATLPAGVNIEASFLIPPVGARLLKRNGQAVLRTTYAALDAAIYCGDGANGTASWGFRCNDPANPLTTRAINGTHIVLPDARGQFGRSLSDGAALDSGRSLWAYQGDEFRSHNHAPIYLWNTWDDNNDDTWLAVGGENQADRRSGPHGQADSSTGYSGGAETRPANYAQTSWVTY